MRFLIPMIVLAMLAITPTDAQARVFVSVTMHGRVNVCSEMYLQCDPRAVVWTPAGYMCPASYRIYVQFHPVYVSTHRSHRRGHVAHRSAQHRRPAHRQAHSQRRNGHNRRRR